MDRRPIGKMPFRRRHQGMNPVELKDEAILLVSGVSLVVVALALIPNPVANVFVALAAACFGLAESLRTMVYNILDPINPENRDRTIASFTEEDCWRVLRFRKPDLYHFMNLLHIPAMFELNNHSHCSGEYALCVMLWRLHYPTTLAGMQDAFGRDYSQISRVFTAIVHFVHQTHKGKVTDCIDWYADRFDLYRHAIRAKIATHHANDQPGTIPIHLDNVFGFVDGTAAIIARPFVSFFRSFLLYIKLP